VILEWKASLNRLEGERDTYKAQHTALSLRITEINVESEVLERSQAVIQLTAEETQNQLRFHLQDLVNSALNSVFPGVYEFHIDFTPKNGTTAADIYLLKDGCRVDPMDSSGGGVVDVVCFALRLVAWSIGKTDNVIVFDEPMKWLSVGLRPLAGELFRKLSHQLGIQMIYVTHDPELADVADRIFEVSQVDEISKVTVKEGTPQ